jgi:peroxiredoxin
MAIPDLIELNEQYKDRGFALITLSIDEPLSTVKSFSEERGITYAVLIDDKDVSSDYGVRNIPTTFIMDKEGKIVSKHLGYAPDFLEVFSKEIEALL